MKIHVTAEDISHGVARDCDRCPIARAIARATGSEEWSARRYSVDNLGAFDRAPVDVPLPINAMLFIAKFDRGADVGPFTFEIDLPTR